MEKKDGLLEIFVSLANKVEGFQISVTISVKGSLVSGLIIGHEEYKKLLIQSFRHSSGPFNIGEVLADQLEKGFSQKVSSSDDEGDDEDSEINFIHLRNAQIIAPSGEMIPNGEGFLWRGRIDSIDGFTFSQISPKQR